MSGEIKLAAAKATIKMLHENGYIGDRRKAELEYKLTTGDTSAFEEIRGFLIEIANTITK